MARIVAIDYGTKRVGFAVSDPMQIIATALDTVHTKDAVQFLKNYMEKEKVDCIVIGEPKQLNNESSEMEEKILGFINEIRKKIPNVVIKRIDERFTSKIAQQSMLESGMKKMQRRNKEIVDQISATLILQSYLELSNH